MEVLKEIYKLFNLIPDKLPIYKINYLNINEFEKKYNIKFIGETPKYTKQTLTKFIQSISLDNQKINSTLFDNLNFVESNEEKTKLLNKVHYFSTYGKELIEKITGIQLNIETILFNDIKELEKIKNIINEQNFIVVIKYEDFLNLFKKYIIQKSRFDEDTLDIIVKIIKKLKIKLNEKEINSRDLKINLLLKNIINKKTLELDELKKLVGYLYFKRNFTNEDFRNESIKLNKFYKEKNNYESYYSELKKDYIFENFNNLTKYEIKKLIKLIESYLSIIHSNEGLRNKKFLIFIKNLVRNAELCNFIDVNKKIEIINLVNRILKKSKKNYIPLKKKFIETITENIDKLSEDTIISKINNENINNLLKLRTAIKYRLLLIENKSEMEKTFFYKIRNGKFWIKKAEEEKIKKIFNLSISKIDKTNSIGLLILTKNDNYFIFYNEKISSNVPNILNIKNEKGNLINITKIKLNYLNSIFKINEEIKNQINTKILENIDEKELKKRDDIQTMILLSKIN